MFTSTPVTLGRDTINDFKILFIFEGQCDTGNFFTFVETSAQNAFQRCYPLLQQYPRFKERYTVQFTGDDRLMVQ